MIENLFRDRKTIEKIQDKLPELFHIAELESSRAGRIGMEVGSVREKILIALLIYKFKSENVETNLPIHEPEIDVIVMDNPISIKTITGSRVKGVKLIWTVDREKALEFGQNYEPKCDMLLAHINWDGEGGLYYFTKNLQMSVMEEWGREEYMKLPKPGTNPRGVEISTDAIRFLARHPQAMKISIEWEKKEIEFDPYKRWLELWE
jgi:hypothetical protein